MNVYKSLDSIFPCGSDRTFGEVVSVFIRTFHDNVDLDEIYMKRKAWYVNASVNAFHMHRSLIRDFSNTVRDCDLTERQIRRAKRLVCLAILNSYVDNSETSHQHYSYYLHANSGPNGSVSMWWERKPNDWVEIKDNVKRSLKEMVDTSVGYALVRRIRWTKVPYAG